MRRASEHLSRINSSPRALSFYRTESNGHVVRNNDGEESDQPWEPDDPDIHPAYGSEEHYAQFPEQYPNEADLYTDDNYDPYDAEPICHPESAPLLSNRNFREELENGRRVPFIPLNANLEPVFETFYDRHPHDYETAVERVDLDEHGRLVRTLESNVINTPKGKSLDAPTSTSTPRENHPPSSSQAPASSVARNSAPERQSLPGPSPSNHPAPGQVRPNSLYVDKYVDLRSRAATMKIQARSGQVAEHYDRSVKELHDRRIPYRGSHNVQVHPDGYLWCLSCLKEVISCTCIPCPIRNCGKFPRQCEHRPCPVCNNMTIYCKYGKCQYCDKLFMEGCKCSPCNICQQIWVLCTSCLRCNRRNEDCCCCRRCGFLLLNGECHTTAMHTDLYHLEIVNTVEIPSAIVFAVIFIHQVSAIALENCGLINRECSCDHCNRCGKQLIWCHCDVCYRCEPWTDDCICPSCPCCYRMPNQCPCPICMRCEDQPCICQYPCSQCCHTSLGGRPCQCRRALRCRNCRRDDCPGCMPYPPYEREGASRAHSASQQTPRRMPTAYHPGHWEQCERPPPANVTLADAILSVRIVKYVTLNVYAAGGAATTRVLAQVAKTAINRNAYVLL